MNCKLSADNTGILLLDVQEQLLPVMGKKERVVENIIRLLHLSQHFHLPVIVTEQHPKWLGHTLPQIKERLRFHRRGLFLISSLCR